MFFPRGLAAPARNHIAICADAGNREAVDLTLF
jgi:hypothetical protein